MRCYHCMTEVKDDARYCPQCGKSPRLLNPPHHLSAGTVLFGKYLVGNAIGEGGFGITYVGYDEKLDLKVAIKEFFPSGFANRNNTVSNNVVLNYSRQGEYFSNGKENFLREAQSLAKFSNERGVVDVREFFTENNTAYIVMEYLDGVNLSKYISKHGVFPSEQICRLMLPVIRSLEKIHKEGIIHRDISPDNIVYLSGGGMKLTDFGSARYFSLNKTISLSVVLKPGYAPHEQYGRKSNQGPWTDVYALCATLYKCMTGITPTDAFSRSQSDDLAPPSELGAKISEELEEVIMHGLGIMPEDRYQNMGELYNALASVLAKIEAPNTIIYGDENRAHTVYAENTEHLEAAPSSVEKSITYGDGNDFFQKLPEKPKPEKPLKPLPSSEYLPVPVNPPKKDEPDENDDEKDGKKKKKKKKSKRPNSDTIRTSIKASAVTLALILLVFAIAQLLVHFQKGSEPKPKQSSAAEPTIADDILSASAEARSFVCSSNEFITIGEDKTASLYTFPVFSFTGSKVKKENDKLINNSDLVAVCGNTRIGYFGLKDDGSVVNIKKVVETQGSSFIYTEKFASEIKDWKDVTEIAAGYDFIAGLSEKGTVYTAGNAPDVSEWEEVTAIAADGHEIAGLDKNGVARTTASDETVNAVTAFSCDSAAFCIKRDGSVVRLSKNTVYPDTKAWGNIISLSADPDGHLIGLKRDRTVASIGENSNGRCNISDWGSIAAVKTSTNFTIGKKTDGSFVIATDNSKLMQSFDEVVNENEPSTDTTETKARTFTVKFLNYDGTVHDEQTVEYGKSAKKPDDPTKPDDRNNSYRFKGWMSDYSYVTRDMEIKPIFEPVYRSSN